MCEMIDGSGNTFVNLWLRLQIPTPGNTDHVSWVTHLTTLALPPGVGGGGRKSKKKRPVMCWGLARTTGQLSKFLVSHLMGGHLSPHLTLELAQRLVKAWSYSPLSFVCFQR